MGSGSSAMNFYIRQAEARGYIVACPTALAAPWAATPNEEFLLSVLEEVELLFNVDLNRVYLTGHSMGGYGTWHFAPKFADFLAAVSPMAGGGGGGYNRLVTTNTPIFIFHGRDDPRVGADSDRAAARSLSKTSHDYIYTELDGIGHGFPDSIQSDLFDFFDTRRLARNGGRGGPPTAEVRSSFEMKVGRDEKRYLGDPLEFGTTGEGDKAEWRQLVKELRLGGGKAEAAANRLGEIKAEGSVRPIVSILRHPTLPDDVKVHAARALGLIGHPDGYPGLAVGLRSEDHEVFIASARAMALIGAPKGGEALVKSLGHLVDVLESRKLGSDRLGIIDWNRWLDAFVAAVESLGKLRPEGYAAAIRRTAVERVICAEWDVLHDKGVGQDPARALGKLKQAVVAALTGLDDPDAKAALDEVK